MPDPNPQPIPVAILAKAPLPGQVKTRLEPVLGAVGGAVLQSRLIEHAVATACAADIGPVTLWVTPDETHPIFGALKARHDIAVARQPSGNLGERMLAAFAAHAPVLVIGTDCPALTPDHLRLAATALRAQLDAVVIPAEDGGYVLIGMQHPRAEVFADIEWGSATVMIETRRRFNDLGWCWREPARLWDVDRPEDVTRLQEAGFSALLPLRPS
jgi:rSAM/selenodomain-associated transferase 1